MITFFFRILKWQTAFLAVVNSFATGEWKMETGQSSNGVGRGGYHAANPVQS